MAKTSISFHACRRAQQRGVPTHLVEAILIHHDAEHMAGSGCRVLRVSRQALSGGAAAEVSSQDRGRLARIALVYSDETDCVVTVLRDRAGRSGRRYRRQQH